MWLCPNQQRDCVILLCFLILSPVYVVIVLLPQLAFSLLDKQFVLIRSCFPDSDHDDNNLSLLFSVS